MRRLGIALATTTLLLAACGDGQDSLTDPTYDSWYITETPIDEYDVWCSDMHSGYHAARACVAIPTNDVGDR